MDALTCPTLFDLNVSKFAENLGLAFALKPCNEAIKLNKAVIMVHATPNKIR
jgi:hypothetical protein